MRFSNVSSILALGFSLAALPSTAIAQSTGLDDMVGARAGQAEGELQRRGYRNVGGEKGDDRSYTYWWNADRQQCVTIATMEGRYSSITPSPAPDCHQSASIRPNPSYQGQPAARPRPGYEPDPSYGRPDPSAGQGDAINLVCVGQGEKLGSGYVNTLEWDRYDHKYRSRSGVQTEMKGFASAVTLQIYGNDGRIRLPEKLIPPINSGGDHQHWWQLDDIIVGSSEIRASYRLNGLNKPKIRIDRQSGVITIKGTGQDFSGRCDRVDPGQQRF